jgi:plasmid maintenance system antidote protein VapI
MEPRTYLKNYVAKHGPLPAVAERLGIPYPTLFAVCNGQRGIGHKLAQRMAEADPSLDASVLVWVRPLRDVAAEKKKAA